MHDIDSDTDYGAADTLEVNVLSYPVKTSYKVGEGFDSTGFKMVYNDYNNVGKITDNSANFGFYTSDGLS